MIASAISLTECQEALSIRQFGKQTRDTLSGARGGQYGKNIISRFFFEISRFNHDSLSCWFYYFASCLSSTAKLISLL